jgi:hypothetical protein
LPLTEFRARGAAGPAVGLPHWVFRLLINWLALHF